MLKQWFDRYEPCQRFQGKQICSPLCLNQIDGTLLIQMGNRCDWDHPESEPQLPALSQTGCRFIRDSLELLRVNGKLSSISLLQQKFIEDKLQALRLKNKKEGCLAIKDSELVACYKKSIFFLGGMRDNNYEGEHCSAVYPGGKLYSGAFMDGKPRGAGWVQFMAEGCNGNNLVVFTGEWKDKIWGSVQLNRSGLKRFLEINREVVRKKGLKFIEYSNFDTYFGETEGELAHGYGKYVFRKGDPSKEYPYYEGSFYKGIRSGQGELYYSAISSLKITWHNGKPDGNGIQKMSSISQAVIFNEGVRLLSRPSINETELDHGALIKKTISF